MYLKNGAKVCFAGIALTLTFYSIVELMVFLSYPTSSKIVNESWTTVLRSLLVDQCLVSLFMLQHSLFAIDRVKVWLEKHNLKSLQRTLYVIATALAILNLVKNWRPVWSVSVWSFNVTKVPLLWWGFVALHAIAWTTIYVGTICMDINELLGLKQIYYSIQNLPQPETYKSSDLIRLYNHMRHPSFLSFLVVFWAVPIMSLDRLLLASIWSIYMYLTWNTDHRDYNYQQYQFTKKFRYSSYKSR